MSPAGIPPDDSGPPDPGRDAWHALADALLAEGRRLACVAIDDAADAIQRELDEAIVHGESHPSGEMSPWLLGAGIGVVTAAMLQRRER